MAEVTDKPTAGDAGATDTDRESPADAGTLRLMARDDEDLSVVSAMLQDALVPLVDLRYEKFERRFIGVFNRFCWERKAIEPNPSDPDAPEGALYRRVLCGLQISGVNRVQTRGLDTANRDRPLNLLAVARDEDAVELVFAGGGAIRLQVDAIDMVLSDIGEPWATPFRPDHPDAAAAEAARGIGAVPDGLGGDA